MKKQLITLIAMLLPMLASADAVEIDGIYYNFIPKGKVAEVTSNPNKYHGEVVIPQTVENDGITYKVTSIGSDAFGWTDDLTSVTIPNSVTSIGDHAFASCTGLTSIIIPNSVISIGGSAFDNCSGLTSVNIPDNVTNLGQFSFSHPT